MNTKNPRAIIIISVALGLASVFIGIYCVVNAFRNTNMAPWRVVMVNAFVTATIDAITQEVSTWQD